MNSVPPPKNEQETCDRIIYPLLRAAGYSAHEIAAQRHGKGIPDYILLPDDPSHMLFVEAKAWSVPLLETEEFQALMYCFRNMRRWVVLTNGQEWRLYDCHVLDGSPLDRVILTGKLSDAASMERFLEALSRASVNSGGLETAASNVVASRRETAERNRVRALVGETLPAGLCDSGSDVVWAITAVLREREGLESVTEEDVAGFFRRHQASAATAPAAPTTEPTPGSVTSTYRGHEALPPDQRLFWTLFRERAHRRGIDTKGWTVPKGDNWIIHEWIARPTNFAYIRRRNRTSVDLYINTGDQTRTARVYHALLAERESIEQGFGHSLDWELHAASGRIAYSIPIGGLDESEAAWAGAHDAMLDAMALMLEVLRARLLDALANA